MEKGPGCRAAGALPRAWAVLASSGDGVPDGWGLVRGTRSPREQRSLRTTWGPFVTRSTTHVSSDAATAAPRSASSAVAEGRTRAVPDWKPGAAFTLGAEDELLLTDGDGRLLGQRALPAMTRLRRLLPGEHTVDGEIFVDEVELRTPACRDAEALRDALGTLRRSAALAEVGLMAVGVHPEAELGTARIAASPRYDRLGEEFAGLLRTPTAAFQVHVGLPDIETAMVVYRALRNRLSIFRALAAGSPYWHGRDSGLACVRSAILRSYPRTTMPPVLRSWEHYVDTIGRQMSAADVPDYTYVCWELRPQPRLGTLEVRVMDAQPSLERAAGLAALLQGLARHAVEVPDRDDLPDEVVLANDFAVCRHGLDARVLDLDGSRRPLRELAARALEDARRWLAPDGLEPPLEAALAILVEPPEYVRQRDIIGRHGMPGLLADLAARTMDVDG
ncbi:MAG TPA: glutamate-cysteine ligase family protein [Nocardioides sp.]|uniref:carboxylate-amine ligase n=1 Tax=Nocardioides sp. TaxID=35761 RepID=UPI002E313E4E|nr:glutamate-cysteine ligase family protein [Nocardioides sp.]HEX5089253.1 glutamate-cysteine ligase family protein [Nocardioides sp.]